MSVMCSRSSFEPAERDFLDQRHHFREALAVHAEDEAPERLVLEQQFIEECGRQAEQGDVVFGDAARGVVRMPEQAPAGQDAALAGLYAVKLDLAAARRGHRDAHRALQHQRKTAAGLLRVEQNRARRDTQDLRLGQQALEAHGREPGKRGEALQQPPPGLLGNLGHRPNSALPRILAGVPLLDLTELNMTVERVVRIFAGTFVLISLALGLWVNQNFFWLTAFVGANLLQSGFTGLCPLASILKRLGLREAHA
jgi:hypothetical protein